MMLAFAAAAILLLRLIAMRCPCDDVDVQGEDGPETGDYGYPLDGAWKIGRASALVH